MNQIKTSFSADKLNVAIIQSRFNEYITENLFKAAKECLIENGLKEENLTALLVPGAFELPVAAEKLAFTKKYDVIICLGAVIRGETPHFDYISHAVSQGIMNVSLKHSLPVIFGVLTTDTVDQAVNRSGEKVGNKGWDAALTAIEMANLFKEIKE